MKDERVIEKQIQEQNKNESGVSYLQFDNKTNL